MFAGKALRCDCGYEVRAEDDEAFVHAIRRHAFEAHGIEFPLELALDVARRAELAPSSGLTVNGASKGEDR
jgi:predicted small metal-binding protein